MEQMHETTKPFWFDSFPKRHYDPFISNRIFDVVIVGAGLTGLTAANILKQAGKSVAIVEMDKVGFGETGHTTAHITEVLDISYQSLIANFGVDGAKLACQSVRKGIQKIEANVKDLSIACGFKRVSAYKYGTSPVEIPWLEAEADAAIRLGVPNTVTTDIPLPFRATTAVRFDHQARFHPLQYLATLARNFSGDGCFLSENTRVLDVEDGQPCHIHTDRGPLHGHEVLVAANVPILNRFFLHTKIAPYRTYAMASTLNGSWGEDSLFWDTANPYHYVRTHAVGDRHYLITGGYDHKTGQEDHTEMSFQKLEDWTRKHFDVNSVTHRWSGQIINPLDGLPYIGRNSMSDQIYVATGYSGTGITFGTVAALLCSDLILGIENPWEELYSATRVRPFTGALNFISENVDYPSHLLGDRIAPTHESLEILREDDGAIVRVDGKKVAAYRDPEGQTHLMSPVCPHLGCYVHWNRAEKSWDCPCHGSRFSPTGKVLNGPSVHDLSLQPLAKEPPLTPAPYETPTGRPEPLPPLLSLT